MQLDIIAESSCRSFQQHICATFCRCDNYNITCLDKLHVPEQLHTISYLQLAHSVMNEMRAATNVS